jgi:hypothetical protein
LLYFGEYSIRDHTLKDRADERFRERMSELKSISGNAALPAGQLASGAEGIKETIQGFDDAWVDEQHYREHG